MTRLLLPASLVGLWTLSLIALKVSDQWAANSPNASVLSPAIAAEPWGLVNPTGNSPTEPKSETEPSTMAITLDQYQQYRTTIERTQAMLNNAEAIRLSQQYGLNILNITWEDTGRYQNSAVGPNISDMTIQMQQFNPQTKAYELSLMPVIRYPNFTDKTGDVPLERFYIRVGNEKGHPLKRVTLKEFLGNFRNYLHTSNSWKGRTKSLLAPRDTHVLVSAQACFLPIPAGGKAEFNPVLFNYQSYEKNPAVLAILVTREGTSATIIDNKRDGFAAGRTWGQRLFFNKNGSRASLTGQRASDFGSNPDAPTSSIPLTSEQAESSGLNMVMLIQVPLKQKPQPRRDFSLNQALPSAAPMMESASRGGSNVEAAVIGHGRVEGPYTEIDNLPIERDPRFPIRVTVQFYKATSNGMVSPEDMRQINAQISRVYQDADFVGSLVVDGSTGRPTEYQGPKQEPPGWWEDFWQRYEANSGQSRQEAMEMLRKLRGLAWMPKTQAELQKALTDSNRQPQP
ncbi:hypothetical protein RIF25_02220 [Thermosynechococcaceae cyanobacterium BACA0444]|uniref:Uncharacterized protein n=1 Tax=Pseudocalidococcus azoricus BACA0444 TaxID=2918990 RepID=A0AAE4FRE6_9CYAN|nr:hypothetical protein [Pseudocalidococcus azoricus]MDS3859615.1 hypothetical protein [Pseudocalidococcus azoricus BACA0444]